MTCPAGYDKFGIIFALHPLIQHHAWEVEFGRAGMPSPFTLCEAFRLAMFNTTDDSSCFQGVPITIAGSLLAAAVILVPNRTVILVTHVLLICIVRIPKA